MRAALLLLLLVGCGGTAITHFELVDGGWVAVDAGLLEDPQPIAVVDAGPEAVDAGAPEVVDAGTPDAGQPEVDAGQPLWQPTLSIDNGPPEPIIFTLLRSSGMLEVRGYFVALTVAGVLPLQGESCLNSFWLNPSSQPDSYALRLPQPGVCSGVCLVTLETFRATFDSTGAAHGQSTGSTSCSSGVSHHWSVSF